MPRDGGALRRARVARAADVVPIGVGRVEGIGEREVEQVVVRRGGEARVAPGVVLVGLAAVDEEDVVDEGVGLAPSAGGNGVSTGFEGVAISSTGWIGRVKRPTRPFRLRPTEGARLVDGQSICASSSSRPTLV